MDCGSLFYSLDIVAVSGHTLNMEQRAALQTSTTILKKQHRFRRLMFWGRILGLKKDYFLVQGRGEDEMKDVTFLYRFFINKATMETNTLSHFLEMVAGCGCTLNMERRAALQTSMILLRKKEQFSRILFWGKVMGRALDYFIVQGRGADELKDKKYLYSLDCLEWFTLPQVTDTMIEQVSLKAKGRFYGDPAHVYGGNDENEKTPVTEEHRLAVAVHQIESEVSVIPRGAFIKMARGMVQVNRSFAGLSYMEAGKLENYLHFSEPKALKKKSLLEMADLNPAYDFLDPLSVDVPNGWSLQFECASTVCTIRSLLWPGLIFYHVPLTVQHGYLYIGDGLRNLDLPFML